MAAYFNFLAKLLLDTIVFLFLLMAIYNVKLSQIARRLPALFVKLILCITYIRRTAAAVLLVHIAPTIYICETNS